MLESKVETYFQDQVRMCGGLTLKFTSPTMRGVPDQIVLYNGNGYFVEMKAPGEKPRESQVAVHELFKDHGITVYTIDTIEMVDQFIKTTLNAEIQPRKTESFEINDNMFF